MSLFPDIYELKEQAEKFAHDGQDSEAIKLYRKLVKKDPEFSALYAYHLGNLYGYGGPCRDDEEALHWYAQVKPNTVSKEKYCDVLRYQGNINRELGRIAKALSYYEEADRLEDPVTQNVMGILYDNGDGLAQSTEKAVHYYKRAIQNGSTDAMVNLSDIYKKSPDTLYEAITLLREAQDKGEPDAQSKLEQVFSDISTEDLRTLCRSMPEEEKYGDAHFAFLSERARRDDRSCFYAYGKALKKRDQIPEAIAAFKRSPARKEGDACFELGLLTEGDESAEYFEKCIQYGLSHEVASATKKAMTRLALHYKSLGNTEKAIEYNEMAISHGYSLGYLRLGEIYREQNLASAEDYFLKAYDAGRKQAAMYLYEYAYARKDYAAAKKWCDETPQKEGNQKLYRLAMLTWNGQGTERDEEKAIELLKQAIKTKDSMDYSFPVERTLFTYYVYKEKADLDTFKEAHQLLLGNASILVLNEGFGEQQAHLTDRIERYFLQETPTWRGHFALAEHYLKNEILEPNSYHAVRHIIEGLGYSWETAAALYEQPRYPQELDDMFHWILKKEMRSASRYELIKLYRPLAEQGHVESMYRLFGQLIRVTKYGTPEYGEVSKWLKKAEKCGHPALQKSMDPLVGFIAQRPYPGIPKVYDIEALTSLAKHCEEKKDERHLAAARLLYLVAATQYEELQPLKVYDGTNGYRYYRIYNLYSTSLIKDAEKEKYWLEEMSGYGYPPADVTWLREHNPLSLYRYCVDSRQNLRRQYQEAIDWGEIKAEDYLK